MGQIEGPAHADHVLKVIAGNDAASSALAASWRRSGALHALDPASRAPSQRLPEDEIARSRERMGSLLFAAQASIDRLFLAVGGVGCSVVLADPRGIIVDRRGAPSDDTLFDSSGLWTGAVWSEKYEGTNGIGTCIVEQRAVTIDRDQHFFTRNSSLFCTTAPIFDEHGDLAAALDVSSARADLVADHGPVMFHQSGGCCDGSSPMCYPKGEFLIGDYDVKMGEIGGAPFYISGSQYEAWKHTDIVIDVIPGRGGMFSLDNGREKRFLVRSEMGEIPAPAKG